jgi:hypothetical protein
MVMASSVVIGIAASKDMRIASATRMASEATGIASEATVIASEATGIASEATVIASEATGIASEVTGVAASKKIGIRVHQHIGILQLCLHFPNPDTLWPGLHAYLPTPMSS